MAVQPKVNAIFVGLEAAAIPPGPSFVEITPSEANEAFKTAISSLPANGGVLYVMPGSADYVFKETVVVGKPNVTIDFVGGSTLRFAANALWEPTSQPDMFLVEMPGFRCTGARVVHSITSANNFAQRSCFRVEADDADISECTFEVQQGDAGDFVIDYFCCVRVVLGPLDPDDTYRLGIRVTRNTFILDTAGFDQALPWIAPNPPVPPPYQTPRGVCCIGVERARGLIVTGNVARSSATGLKAPVGTVFFLATAEQAVVSSNSVRDLRTPPGAVVDPDFPTLPGVPGAIVRMLAKGGEGHHTVLSANVFSELDTAVVIALDDVRYDYVSSNVFDRVGSSTRYCRSVVRALRGSVLGVVANAFTRITGDPNAMPQDLEAAIYLDDLSSFTGSGNLFTEVLTGKGAFAVKPGTCENVQFDAQQAQAGNAS